MRRDWHGGRAYGFRSQWWRFPDLRISFLTTCNARLASRSKRHAIRLVGT